VPEWNCMAPHWFNFKYEGLQLSTWQPERSETWKWSVFDSTRQDKEMGGVGCKSAEEAIKKAHARADKWLKVKARAKR